ncbi:MAG: hypothetical protein WCO44_08205 [Bacteroidota bacterium]
MNTRILLLTALFAIVTCGLFAQQETHPQVYQAGLSFSSLNNFGLNFKTGDEKTLFRVTLLSASMGLSSDQGRTQDSIDIKTSSAGAGFRVGFEKHIPVYRTLRFIWGLEAGGSYSYNKMKQDMSGTYNDYESVTWKITPMADLVLGLTYTISDHLVLGVEIAPSLQYSFGKVKTTNSGSGSPLETVKSTSSVSFGFYNNPATLTLAYRFAK